MPRIFINYRTNDEESCAVLVERELSAVFGTANVFRASKSIPAGAQFESALLRGVWRSEALVAVIGKRWLSASDPRGDRALDNPLDWTRKEILEAFSHDVTVIPLLVNGAERLRPDDLPVELTELATRQYLRFDHRHPDADLHELITRLAGLDGSPVPAPDDGRDSGRRGGIGSITGTTVNAVTDPRGPVNMGSGNQVNQSGFSGDGAMFVLGGEVDEVSQRFGTRRRDRS